MTHESSFPDPLHFQLHGHRNGSSVLALAHYFRYCNPRFPIITVPVGFLTDGASIPRIFWSIIGPHGNYYRAAVIHDFLYNPSSKRHYSAVTRAMADSIFLQAMEDCGVGWITRHTIYRAVRAFGWRSFRKHDTPPLAPLPAS
jgi:hypothetical protein